MKSEHGIAGGRQVIDRPGDRRAGRIEDELVTGKLVPGPLAIEVTPPGGGDDLQVLAAGVVTLGLVPRHCVVGQRSDADQEARQRYPEPPVDAILR